MINSYLLQTNQFAKAILACFDNREDLEAIKNENFLFLKILSKEVEVRAFFEDLTIMREEKIKHLNDFFVHGNFHVLYQNGLKLFIEHGHSGNFWDLIKIIDREILKLLAIKKVVVASAYELTAEQKNKLEAGWKNKLAVQLVFEYQIIPEMVLGIKVRVGDYVEDYSLKSQMKNLCDKISETIS